MALAQPALRAATRSLVVDAATGEVVRAFRARGIPRVLLRGPAIARRLFDPGEVRSYVDIDLLVPPDAREAAGEELAHLGFAPLTRARDLDGHRPLHAREWRRATDRVSVDLHRTVGGSNAVDEDVWREVERTSQTEEVGGEEVNVPGVAALALVVTLHAAHNGPGHKQTITDLQRALQRLDPQTWAEAAELAHRLDAVPAFSAGLRLLPEGTELARELGLPQRLSVDVALRASGAPPLALGFEWLSRRSGFHAKARLVMHVLAPPPGALRSWRTLARRGQVGLAAAYLSQPFWLARHLVPSLLAVRRARGATR